MSIVSKPSTDKYRTEYDRIFRAGEMPTLEDIQECNKKPWCRLPENHEGECDDMVAPV
jgi:hypothetical protein